MKPAAPSEEEGCPVGSVEGLGRIREIAKGHPGLPIGVRYQKRVRGLARYARAAFLPESENPSIALDEVGSVLSVGVKLVRSLLRIPRAEHNDELVAGEGAGIDSPALSARKTDVRNSELKRDRRHAAVIGFGATADIP